MAAFAFALAVAVAGCGSSGAKGDGGGSGGASGGGGSGGAGGALADAGGGADRPADGGGASPDARCLNSLSCGADQVCDPDSGRCVQCLNANDCPVGQQCVSQQCTAQPPTCRASTECAPAKPVCDVPTGRCVRCLTPADCPANNDCTAEACVPYTTCANSLGCPQGQVCDTARMRCVQCVGNNDCSTDDRCVSNVCRKACTSDLMCTPLGMLCDLSRGVCAACLTSTDCATDQYCVNGTCAADLCPQGTSSCQNNAIVRCRADGSGFDPAAACGSNQTCGVTGGVAACRSQICTPTVTYCDPLSEKVLVCAADGLTASTRSDCAADGGKVCVAGGCVPVVCPAGKRFCQGQEVRQCSAKGDASTVAATCTASQFCDTVTPSCKTRLCTPNQPACSGNVRTTCNADGSGYLSGGTDCSPQYCAAGACASAIYRETFEDGTHTRFTVGTGNYSYSGSSTPGANGTNYALILTKAASSTTPDGLSYTLSAAAQPRSVSYWVKAGSTSAGLGYFRLLNGTEVLFYSYFSSGYLYGYWAASYYVVTSTNTWVHVELRNIDWTARTFDYYVNGTMQQTAQRFAGLGTSLNRMELYSAAISYPAYWDEIELLP